MPEYSESGYELTEGEIAAILASYNDRAWRDRQLANNVQGPTFSGGAGAAGGAAGSGGGTQGFSLFGPGGSQAVNTAAFGTGTSAVGSSTPWWQNPRIWGGILQGIGAVGNMGEGGDVGTGRFNVSPVGGGGNLPAGPDINAILELFNRIGGSGGSGGDGGRNGLPGAQQNFLTGLFQNPNSFGNISPQIMGMLNQNQGASNGEYQQFLNTLNQGAGGLFSLLGGGNNPILQQILGSGGGGGFSGSSGGGGNFPTSAAGIFQGLPNLDLERIQAGIPNLPPEVLAQFDTILQSNLADINSQRTTQNSDLVAQLYGRGINQSTLALENINRLNESLERTLLATKSEDAQRRIGTQMELGGRQLTADLARQQGLIDIFGQRLGSATSQAVAGIGASAQTQSASIGAASNMAAARLGALTDLYRTQIGGLTDIYGSQVSGLASGLGSRQGYLGGTFGDLSGLGANLAGLENERFLNLANLAQSGINSRQAAGAAGRNARFEQIMDLLRFQEAVNQRIQGGTLTREGFGVDRELGRMNAPREPSDWDRLLALGGVIGSFYG